MQSVVNVVASEEGEDAGFIYISPKGSRFTSLEEALKHASKDLVRNLLPAGMHETFNAPNLTTMQFTSNHKDYMHRGLNVLFATLPAYIYNIWVYRDQK